MYENLLVYETRARYYLLSYTQDKTRWRVLKISRTEASELDVSEDPVEYSERQAAALLHTLAEGNAGLSLVHRAFGCVGAIRFLEGHYLILVKQRRQVGVLAGHPVYAVEGTEVVELCHPSVKPLRSADEEYAEKRYLRLLELVDLRRHFYYSYGYPLTCSLQRSALGGEQPGECWASLFCWNAHLAQPLAACLGGAASPALSRWVLPLIHGWFGSMPLALCGTPCTLTLLARRSRLFAGTRYRKRGVSDAGNVANDVETEQIVDAGAWPCRRDGTLPPPRCASVLQVRGSIPLFWSQQASPLSPKPDIVLSRYDPFYHATRLHFDSLARRYGGRTVALSLVKAAEKRPREALLRRELGAAVNALNAGPAPGGSGDGTRVALCGWDLSRRAKSGRPEEVVRELAGLTAGALALTRLFVTPRPLAQGCAPRSAADREAARHAAAALGWTAGSTASRVAADAWTTAGAESMAGLDGDPGWDTAPALGGEDVFADGLLQAGVLRTNCIDCLDRTNVAQFALGSVALGVQLLALGLADGAALSSDAPCLEALSGLYQAMGDALAQQYGGSDAHNPVLAAAAAKQAPRSEGPGAVSGAGGSHAPSSAWHYAGGYSRELLTSVRRFYSATVTDAEKQDAINVFLGHFVPRRGRPQVWELESDVWLHTAAGGAGGGEWALGEMEAHGTSAGLAQKDAGRLHWDAWEGRRSPGGRTAKAEAGGAGPASFDNWSEGSVEPARIYPPGQAGGYTFAAPGLAAATAAHAEAAARAATLSAAAASRERAHAQRRARRAAAVRSSALDFVDASVLRPTMRGAEAAQARERYSQAHTQRHAWSTLFDARRAVAHEAERAEEEAALTPAEALERERRAEAAQDEAALAERGANAVSPRPAGPTPPPGPPSHDATLAAARGFLIADSAVGAPEWLSRVAASAMAAAALSPRPSQPPPAVVPPPAAPPSPPEHAHAHPPTQPTATPFPPSAGAELRLWLRERGATARREAEKAMQPLQSLGSLGPGVLRGNCPPAANVHAMARCQLQRLIEGPCWSEVAHRPGAEVEDPAPPRIHIARTSARRASGVDAPATPASTRPTSLPAAYNTPVRLHPAAGAGTLTPAAAEVLQPRSRSFKR